MAPFKSSLAKTVGKLLGLSKNADLSLRGNAQVARVLPVESSGGTKSTYNDKTIHAFTSTGPSTLEISGGAG